MEKVKKFFDFFFSAIFIAEIMAITIAIIVGIVPTNVRTFAIITDFIMVIVAICSEVSEKSNAPKPWSEIKINTDVLE